jgi:septum formation protein
MLMLASASPRRAEILRTLGVPFRVLAPDAEEIVLCDDARATAQRNALAKFQWCRDRCPDCRILAADTVIDMGLPAEVVARWLGEWNAEGGTRNSELGSRE